MLNRLLIGVLCFLPLVIYAQVVDAPPVAIEDVFRDIAELVKNFKGMTGIAIASSIITILVQILKTELMGSLFKKLNPFIRMSIITILGQLAGITIAISGGMGILDAIVAGLLTSGGAVAIWNAIKPFFKKENK